ncbi:hypothetical protein Bhyg_17897, partial [Pseudolycoriella hygida]
VCELNFINSENSMSLVPYDISDDDGDLEEMRTPIFNLEEVLQTDEGVEIKEYYHEKQVRSPKMAKLLETYYCMPKGSKNPSGMLYAGYNNAKRQKKLHQGKNRIGDSSLDDTSPLEIVRLNEIQESVKFFLDGDIDSAAEDTLFQHWEVCYSYRHNNFRKGMLGNLESILGAWPILMKPYGYKLINLDCITKFGVTKSNSLVQNWTTRLINKLPLLNTFLKDPKQKKKLYRIERKQDGNTKNVGIEKALHYLLSPGTKGHSRTWLPTMKASWLSVYKFVNYTHQIDLELGKRATFCKNKNFKEHPMIFGLGPSKNSVEEFVVAFGN